MENDGEVYRQMQRSFIPNLDKKVKQGKYDSALAPKLWMHLVDFAAEKYVKDYGSGGGRGEARTTFPTTVRKEIADDLRDEYERELPNRGMHIHKDRHLCTICQKHEVAEIDAIGPKVMSDARARVAARRAALKVGDKVASKGARKGTSEYDEGKILSIDHAKQQAQVAWRKAGQTYREALDDLKKTH